MRRTIERKIRELFDKEKQEPNTTAIVLSGGGARAAYQVGVLKYIADAFPDAKFQVMTGVSAGAINIGQMANHVGSFRESVGKLQKGWEKLTIDNVFKPESTINFFRKLLLSGSGMNSGEKITTSMARQKGLADSSPLREYLIDRLGVGEDGRLSGITENINSKRLKAVSFTTTNYSTGQTTTFVEGFDISSWIRPYRAGVMSSLGVEHIMASSALPLIFPAVLIDGAWYGDGGVRLTSPLSPAINMGADRIFVISTRYNRSGEEANKPSILGYPPAAQVIGILMNAIFLDVLDHDAMRLERINELLEGLPEKKWQGLRPIKLLMVRPSKDIGQLAHDIKPPFSGALRLFTSGIGSDETESPDWMSMLLFEEEYISRLIDIGYKDGAQQHDDIDAFFNEQM